MDHVLSIFVIFHYLFDQSRSKKDSKSIIALEDIIYRSVREEKLWTDIVGKEIK